LLGHLVLRIKVKVSPRKVVDTIGADYFFVFEQVLSACCAKFRKEQAKQIIEIIQEPFHGIKVQGFRIGGELL
jgi:hypothetical protein